KAKQESIATEIRRLERTRYGNKTLAQILRRPEISYSNLHHKSTDLSYEIIQQVEIAIKYDGYISRQEVEVAKFKTLEDKEIPDGFDYASVPSLRHEARQKFIKI